MPDDDGVWTREATMMVNTHNMTNSRTSRICPTICRFGLPAAGIVRRD